MQAPARRPPAGALPMSEPLATVSDMTIEILPATGDRFDDAERALDSGDGPECQCQWWLLPNGPWEKASIDDRTEMFRTELVLNVRKS